MDERNRSSLDLAAGELDEDIMLQGLRQSPLVSSRGSLLRPRLHKNLTIEIDSSVASAVSTPTAKSDHNSILSETITGNVSDNGAHHNTATRLVPILPPEGYQHLDWRPASLQTWILVVMTVSSFGIAVATFGLWHGAGSDLQITLTNENVHILSTYLPAIVATVTVRLFETTVRDFWRMTPFYAMADSKHVVGSGAKASHSVGGLFFPWSELFFTIRLGPLLWLFNFLHLSLFLLWFLIGAKVSLLSSVGVTDGWSLTVNRSEAIFVIAAYLIMGFTYLLILSWVSRHQTGLKCEPTSIQDHLTLFSETRAITKFERLLASDKQASQVLPDDETWRIGYWRKDRHDLAGNPIRSIVYGICPIPLSGGYANIDEDTLPMVSGITSLQTPCNCQKYPRCRHGPRRYCMRATLSSQLSQCFYLLFYLAGIGAAVFLVASGKFIHGFVLRHTWYYNVIFRWVLVQIAYMTIDHVAFLDMSVRASQPYISMAHEASPGPDSIGLEYLTMMAFQIPLVAFAKAHYRIAWFTTINSISSLCPIMVAGAFIMTPQDGYVDYQVSKVSFFVILFYCFVFPVTIIWAWTKEVDRLPRLLVSLADQMSLCCGARILDEPGLNIASPNMTREKYLAKMTLLENKYRLGYYMGTCGHEHFGFDVVETSDERIDLHDSTCNFVTPVTRRPGSGSNADSLIGRFRVRRQQIPSGDREEEEGMVMQMETPRHS